MFKRQYRPLSSDEIDNMDGLEYEYTSNNDYMILFVRIPRNITAITNNLTSEEMVELPNMEDIITLNTATTSETYEVLNVISDYSVSVNTGIVVVQKTI